MTIRHYFEPFYPVSVILNYTKRHFLVILTDLLYGITYLQPRNNPILSLFLTL